MADGRYYLYIQWEFYLLQECILRFWRKVILIIKNLKGAE